MIKGIDVTLQTLTQKVVDNVPVFDELGEPVYTEGTATVKNVLVYPSSPEAVVTDLQLYGKRSVYQICIPKGDTNIWEDRTVTFFGKTFRTFGPVIEYIQANVPGKWNKQTRVELYE